MSVERNPRPARSVSRGRLLALINEWRGVSAECRETAESLGDQAPEYLVKMAEAVEACTEDLIRVVASRPL